MSFFDRLFGREEEPDKTKGNWYDPEPQATRYNHSPNRLVNGGLRDLLGALADAHSQSQGMDPLYAPKRQQEKVSEAMSGYDTDPLNSIKRVSQVNAPLGQKYLDSYLDSQDRKRNYESQDEARRALADDRAERQALQAQARFAGMLKSVDGPEAYDRLKPILSKFAERFPKAGLEVPDVFNADWVTATRDGAILPKDQVMMDYRDRNLDERGRHNRATEGTAALRANTDREYKRAGVVNNAAKTTISAARLGLDAGDDTADNAGGQAVRAERARTNQVRERISQQNANSGSARSGTPQRGGGGGQPPLAPRKQNDRVRGPDGTVWTSPDGKTWKKA